MASKTHCYVVRSITYRRSGDIDKAVADSKRAIEIRQKVLGKNHSSVGVALSGLGNTYIDKKDYQKAWRCYEEVERIFGEKHPSIGARLSAVYQTSTLNHSNSHFDFYFYPAISYCWINSGKIRLKLSSNGKLLDNRETLFSKVSTAILIIFSLSNLLISHFDFYFYPAISYCWINSGKIRLKLSSNGKLLDNRETLFSKVSTAILIIFSLSNPLIFNYEHKTYSL